MRVVSSRELSSSLTRARDSCSSDSSSSTSSSPVTFKIKIKGCNFKYLKWKVLETVCVSVSFMIAWPRLQKQLLQGRNTHLTCPAHSLQGDKVAHSLQSTFFILRSLWLSSIWLLNSLKCEHLRATWQAMPSRYSDQTCQSSQGQKSIVLKNLMQSISSYGETDPKSLFNRLLSHHLSRLLSQVQLQKLLKAHLWDQIFRCFQFLWIAKLPRWWFHSAAAAPPPG